MIGGVIVGLFSFKLGRMLHGYFFGAAERTVPDGSAERRVPAVAKPE